jgi:hypothetical protein
MKYQSTLSEAEVYFLFLDENFQNANSKSNLRDFRTSGNKSNSEAV